MAGRVANEDMITFASVEDGDLDKKSVMKVVETSISSIFT